MDDIDIGMKLKPKSYQWNEIGVYHGKSRNELLETMGELPSIRRIKQDKEFNWKVKLAFPSGDAKSMYFLDFLGTYQSYGTDLLNEIKDNKDTSIVSRSKWNNLVSFADAQCSPYRGQLPSKGSLVSYGDAVCIVTKVTPDAEYFPYEWNNHKAVYLQEINTNIRESNGIVMVNNDEKIVCLGEINVLRKGQLGDTPKFIQTVAYGIAANSAKEALEKKNDEMQERMEKTEDYYMDKVIGNINGSLNDNNYGDSKTRRCKIPIGVMEGVVENLKSVSDLNILDNNKLYKINGPPEAWNDAYTDCLSEEVIVNREKFKYFTLDTEFRYFKKTENLVYDWKVDRDRV